MTATTKWLTAGVLALTTAGAATAGPPAGYTPQPFPQVPQYPGPYNPGPFPPRPLPHPAPPAYDTDYVVLVKAFPFGGWSRYGRFETLHGARRAAWRLEEQGYRVRVEPVYGGPPRW
ncbi:MAG: hypothetical protein K2X87_24480 [Gemmataceae bacterium]|nr:hypothetical protein [Gemmataceae bacterium]